MDVLEIYQCFIID